MTGPSVSTNKSASADNTTLSTIPRLISQVLPIYEIDAASLFQRVGLDLNLLQTTDVRVPMAQMSELWQLASEVTGNEELGLVAASLFQPAYLKGLGLAWMVSENLVEGLKLFIRNSQLVNTALQIELVTEGDELFIKYKRDTPSGQLFNVQPCAIQLGVSFFLKMFRLAAGKSIPATGAYFTFPIVEKLDVYEAYFQCPVYGESDFNGISFSTKLLQELLPTHDSDLLALNKTAVSKYLASLKLGAISERVSEVVSALLTSGCPTEEEIAYRLHMSKRTLQRKLKAEGQSYSTLLASIRFDLAKEFLSTSSMPITDVAYQLGYSSPSTFARAFKQQFGEAPLAYRSRY